jgi:hypothetical protein
VKERPSEEQLTDSNRSQERFTRNRWERIWNTPCSTCDAKRSEYCLVRNERGYRFLRFPCWKRMHAAYPQVFPTQMSYRAYVVAGQLRDP